GGKRRRSVQDWGDLAVERRLGEDHPPLLRCGRAPSFGGYRGGLPDVLGGGSLAIGAGAHLEGRGVRPADRKAPPRGGRGPFGGARAPGGGRGPPAQNPDAPPRAPAVRPGRGRRPGRLLPRPGAGAGSAGGEGAGGLPGRAPEEGLRRGALGPGHGSLVLAGDRLGDARRVGRGATGGVGGAGAARLRRDIRRGDPKADATGPGGGRGGFRSRRLEQGHESRVRRSRAGRAGGTPADRGARARRGGGLGRGLSAGLGQARRPALCRVDSLPLRADPRSAHGALLGADGHHQEVGVRPGRRGGLPVAHRGTAPADRGKPARRRRGACDPRL
ncbi:MAG: transcriptional regulator, MerR family, partial [uncultured Rubrobacteraceae bacterium]